MLCISLQSLPVADTMPWFVSECICGHSFTTCVQVAAHCITMDDIISCDDA